MNAEQRKSWRGRSDHPARDWFAELDRNAGRRSARYIVGNALDDRLLNFSGKSIDKTRYTIERYLRPKLGDIEVVDLTTERLRQFQEELAGTCHQRSTSSSVARLLKANTAKEIAATGMARLPPTASRLDRSLRNKVRACSRWSGVIFDVSGKPPRLPKTGIAVQEIVDQLFAGEAGHVVWLIAL